MTVLRILILMLFIASSTFTWACELCPNQSKKLEISGTKPNSIRLFKTRYIFSFKEYRYNTIWYEMRDWGISYERKFGKSRRHALEVAFDENFFTYYTEKGRVRKQLGDVYMREYYHGIITWKYSILREDAFSVEPILGISYKVGDESRMSSVDRFGSVHGSYLLLYRDPGVIAGLNVEYRIAPFFHIFGTTYATGIVWRHAPNRQSFANPNRPLDTPQTSLTFRLGIGYSFGKGLEW